MTVLVDLCVVEGWKLECVSAVRERDLLQLLLLQFVYSADQYHDSVDGSFAEKVLSSLFVVVEEIAFCAAVASEFRIASLAKSIMKIVNLQ